MFKFSCSKKSLTLYNESYFNSLRCKAKFIQIVLILFSSYLNEIKKYIVRWLNYTQVTEYLFWYTVMDLSVIMILLRKFLEIKTFFSTFNFQGKSYEKQLFNNFQWFQIWELEVKWFIKIMNIIKKNLPWHEI